MTERSRHAAARQGGCARWRSGAGCPRTSGMPAPEAIVVDAGGRDLRVTNPDRVIFPPTDHSGPVTKLDIVKYYLSVGDGIMRALARRPTTLERWPTSVHP